MAKPVISLPFLEPAYIRIPSDRIAALIGKGGETKREIEKKTGTKIGVNSEDGEVEISPKGDDWAVVEKAKNIVGAIGRGFSPERAMKLLDDDYYIEVIDLSEIVGKSSKAIQQRRARLIGSGGKARAKIEQATNCAMSVYGKTVSIIGRQEGIEKARKAIDMLIGGAAHTTVFDRLERKRHEGEKFEL